MILIKELLPGWRQGGGACGRWEGLVLFNGVQGLQYLLSGDGM